MSAFPAAVGSATEDDAAFDRSYVDRTLEAYAEETLALLAEEGIIEAASLDSFDTRTHRSLGTFATAATGTTVVSTDKNWVSTASVRTKATTGRGTVTLVVEPESERSYALLDAGGRASCPTTRVRPGSISTTST